VTAANAGGATAPGAEQPALVDSAPPNTLLTGETIDRDTVIVRSVPPASRPLSN